VYLASNANRKFLNDVPKRSFTAELSHEARCRQVLNTGFLDDFNVDFTKDFHIQYAGYLYLAPLIGIKILQVGLKYGCRHNEYLPSQILRVFTPSAFYQRARSKAIENASLVQNERAPDMNALSSLESQRFKQCERVIEKNLLRFCEMGDALLKICDKRYYGAEFKTFENYCCQRWAMKKSQAYRVINAAKVVANPWIALTLTMFPFPG
jgi:hypothetical protein